MCRAASNAPAGLPSKRFSTSVTHSNPSPISTLSGTRVRRRAATEKLSHHFHQNRGNHGKKTGQQACDRRSKGPQNSIRSNNQQSVAAQEFQIDTRRNLRPARPGLRRGKPRQRIHALLHPAIVYPGKDRSGRQSRRCPRRPTRTRLRPSQKRRCPQSTTQSGAPPRDKTLHPPPLAPPSVFSARERRRITSHTPAPNPRKPRMSVNRGEVCNQRSNKYPAPPAITMLKIKMAGSSMAIATCVAPLLGRLRGAGFSEDITRCRSLAAHHWPKGVNIE